MSRRVSRGPGWRARLARKPGRDALASAQAQGPEVRSAGRLLRTTRRIAPKVPGPEPCLSKAHRLTTAKLIDALLVSREGAGDDDASDCARIVDERERLAGYESL